MAKKQSRKDRKAVTEQISKAQRKKAKSAVKPAVKRELEKMRRATLNRTPKLASILAKLEPLVYEANSRWLKIREAGLNSIAIEKAKEEQGGIEYFSTDYITSEGKALALKTRMELFIRDIGSTIQGAMLQNEQLKAIKYKGKFGGSEHTDPSIDKNIASRAFRAYRMIAEEYGYRRIKELYGSENLITELYQIQLEGGSPLVEGRRRLQQQVYFNLSTVKKEFEIANENIIRQVNFNLSSFNVDDYNF